mmetsp:Transcript_69688/g.185676  ORF Transcript_69688/g.185676 Transcript_69688/m.185676 type:complete len:150 (+) Transcript_69688:109-558(+)
MLAQAAQNRWFQAHPVYGGAHHIAVLLAALQRVSATAEDSKSDLTWLTEKLGAQQKQLKSVSSRCKLLHQNCKKRLALHKTKAARLKRIRLLVARKRANQLTAVRSLKSQVAVAKLTLYRLTGRQFAQTAYGRRVAKWLKSKQAKLRAR